jgi:tetratricopeptide (TPR) repeat protein
VLVRAEALRTRLPGLSGHVLWLIAAKDLMQLALNERWEGALPVLEPLLDQPVVEFNFALPGIRLIAARIYAFLGREADALRLLGTLAPQDVESFGVGTLGSSGDAVLALWLLERTDSVDAMERVTRRGLASDFQSPMADWRLSLARLSALQRRYDEATDWFAQARAALDALGARTLRAIVDYDEALMFIRRRADGDRSRALPLLSAALVQFREIGMTGWMRRAEELQASLTP